MRAGTGISRASVAMLGHREGDGEKLGGCPSPLPSPPFPGHSPVQRPAGSDERGAEVTQLRVPVAQCLQVQLQVVVQVLGHETHEVAGRAAR